jgi:hypothetical protein
MVANSSAVDLEQRREQQQYDARVQFNEDGRRDVTAMGWCDDKLPATVTNFAAAVVAVAIVWCLLRVNTTPELMAIPGGSLASIFVLYVTGTVAGWLVGKLGGLPPLLGMMLAGIFLQNTGLYTVTGWCFHLVSTMR